MNQINFKSKTRDEKVSQQRSSIKSAVQRKANPNSAQSAGFQNLLSSKFRSKDSHNFVNSRKAVAGGVNLLAQTAREKRLVPRELHSFGLRNSHTNVAPTTVSPRKVNKNLKIQPQKRSDRNLNTVHNRHNTIKQNIQGTLQLGALRGQQPSYYIGMQSQTVRNSVSGRSGPNDVGRQIEYPGSSESLSPKPKNKIITKNASEDPASAPETAPASRPTENASPAQQVLHPQLPQGKERPPTNVSYESGVRIRSSDLSPAIQNEEQISEKNANNLNHLTSSNKNINATSAKSVVFSNRDVGKVKSKIVQKHNAATSQVNIYRTESDVHIINENKMIESEHGSKSDAPEKSSKQDDQEIRDVNEEFSSKNGPIKGKTLQLKSARCQQKSLEKFIRPSDHTQKCYKIPSISKCLEFKIMPKTAQVLKHLCLQASSNPQATIEPLRSPHGKTQQQQEHDLQNDGELLNKPFNHSGNKHRRKGSLKCTLTTNSLATLNQRPIYHIGETPNQGAVLLGASSPNEKHITKCKKIVQMNVGSFAQIPIQNLQLNVDQCGDLQQRKLNRYWQMASLRPEAEGGRLVSSSSQRSLGQGGGLTNRTDGANALPSRALSSHRHASKGRQADRQTYGPPSQRKLKFLGGVQNQLFRDQANQFHNLMRRASNPPREVSSGIQTLKEDPLAFQQNTLGEQERMNQQYEIQEDSCTGRTQDDLLIQKYTYELQQPSLNQDLSSALKKTPEESPNKNSGAGNGTNAGGFIQRTTNDAPGQGAVENDQIRNSDQPPTQMDPLDYRQIKSDLDESRNKKSMTMNSSLQFLQSPKMTPNSPPLNQDNNQMAQIAEHDNYNNTRSIRGNNPKVNTNAQDNIGQDLQDFTGQMRWQTNKNAAKHKILLNQKNSRHNVDTANSNDTNVLIELKLPLHKIDSGQVKDDESTAEIHGGAQARCAPNIFRDNAINASNVLTPTQGDPNRPSQSMREGSSTQQNEVRLEDKKKNTSISFHDEEDKQPDFQMQGHKIVMQQRNIHGEDTKQLFAIQKQSQRDLSSTKRRKLQPVKIVTGAARHPHDQVTQRHGTDHTEEQRDSLLLRQGSIKDSVDVKHQIKQAFQNALQGSDKGAHSNAVSKPSLDRFDQMQFVSTDRPVGRNSLGSRLSKESVTKLGHIYQPPETNQYDEKLRNTEVCPKRREEVEIGKQTAEKGTGTEDQQLADGLVFHPRKEPVHVRLHSAGLNQCHLKGLSSEKRKCESARRLRLLLEEKQRRHQEIQTAARAESSPDLSPKIIQRENLETEAAEWRAIEEPNEEDKIQTLQIERDESINPVLQFANQMYLQPESGAIGSMSHSSQQDYSPVYPLRSINYHQTDKQKVHSIPTGHLRKSRLSRQQNERSKTTKGTGHTNLDLHTIWTTAEKDNDRKKQARQPSASNGKESSAPRHFPSTQRRDTRPLQNSRTGNASPDLLQSNNPTENQMNEQLREYEKMDGEVLYQEAYGMKPLDAAYYRDQRDKKDQWMADHVAIKLTEFELKEQIPIQNDKIRQYITKNNFSPGRGTKAFFPSPQASQRKNLNTGTKASAVSPATGNGNSQFKASAYKGSTYSHRSFMPRAKSSKIVQQRWMKNAQIKNQVDKPELRERLEDVFKTSQMILSQGASKLAPRDREHLLLQKINSISMHFNMDKQSLQTYVAQEHKDNLRASSPTYQRNFQMLYNTFQNLQNFYMLYHLKGPPNGARGTNENLVFDNQGNTLLMETNAERTTDLSAAFTQGHTSGEAARHGIDQKREHDLQNAQLPHVIHHHAGHTVNHFDLQEDQLAQNIFTKAQTAYQSSQSATAKVSASTERLKVSLDGLSQPLMQNQQINLSISRSHPAVTLPTERKDRPAPIGVHAIRENLPVGALNTERMKSASSGQQIHGLQANMNRYMIKEQSITRNTDLVAKQMPILQPQAPIQRHVTSHFPRSAVLHKRGRGAVPLDGQTRQHIFLSKINKDLTTIPGGETDDSKQTQSHQNSKEQYTTLNEYGQPQEGPGALRRGTVSTVGRPKEEGKVRPGQGGAQPPRRPCRAARAPSSGTSMEDKSIEEPTARRVGGRTARDPSQQLCVDDTGVRTALEIAKVETQPLRRGSGSNLSYLSDSPQVLAGAKSSFNRVYSSPRLNESKGSPLVGMQETMTERQDAK